MKKYIALLLTVTVLFAFVPAAPAEGGSGDYRDSLSGFFGDAAEKLGQWAGDTAGDIASWADDAWKNAASWAEGAFKDASAWIDSAWGDAARWLGDAWTDSSSWVSGIWGDVSGWIAENGSAAADAVGAWWAETFSEITGVAGDAWEWLKDRGSELKESELFTAVKEAIASAGSAGEELKPVLESLLKKLELGREEIEKVWLTLKTYAEENGISLANTVKLALPYLLQLTVDSAAEGSVPAVAVAQYLTAVLEKLSSTEGGLSDGLVNRLMNALKGI